MTIELYAAAISFQVFFHAGFLSYNIILEMDAQVVIQVLLIENSDLLVKIVSIEEVNTFFLLLQFSYLYIYS